MRLTSTVPAYLALAEITDDVAREFAWVEQYEAAHREVFDTYYLAWGRRDRRADASRDVPRLAPAMRATEDRARRLVDEAETYFTSVGLIDDDLDVVLMLGACTSDGWVTDVGGRATLFLALEFLGEPPYDAVLISHEAFHVAHARHGAGGWPDDCASSLFQEGMAVALSRELHPGLPDSAYLWFDDAHADWVAQCETAAGSIAARALAELDTSYDELPVRALFTIQEDENELPPRAGYWLGDLAVRRLLEDHPSRELLSWDLPTVRTALATLLPTLAGGISETR